MFAKWLIFGPWKFILAARPADKLDNHLKAGRLAGLVARNRLATTKAASRRISYAQSLRFLSEGMGGWVVVYLSLWGCRWLGDGLCTFILLSLAVGVVGWWSLYLSVSLTLSLSLSLFLFVR